MKIYNQPFVTITALWEHLKAANIQYNTEYDEGMVVTMDVTPEQIEEIEQALYDAGDWNFSWGDNNRSMIDASTFTEALSHDDSEVETAVIEYIGTLFAGLDKAATKPGGRVLQGTVLIDLEN